LILFTALIPPDDVLAALAAELGETGDDLRWSPPANWHVTLAYYGEDDPETRAEWLAERLAGRSPVDVRLENAATFPGVLWLTVAGDDLPPLANAAGADAEDRPYQPHLTLARFARERPGLAKPWTWRLSGFTSRSWQATEVALMSSEREPGGIRYRVVRSFELNRA